MASEELIKTKCRPILRYGLEVCPSSKTNLRSLNFPINRFFIKLLPLGLLMITDRGRCPRRWFPVGGRCPRGGRMSFVRPRWVGRTSTRPAIKRRPGRAKSNIQLPQPAAGLQDNMNASGGEARRGEMPPPPAATTSDAVAEHDPGPVRHEIPASQNTAVFPTNHTYYYII